MQHPTLNPSNSLTPEEKETLKSRSFTKLILNYLNSNPKSNLNTRVHNVVLDIQGRFFDHEDFTVQEFCQRLLDKAGNFNPDIYIVKNMAQGSKTANHLHKILVETGVIDQQQQSPDLQPLISNRREKIKTTILGVLSERYPQTANFKHRITSSEIADAIIELLES